MHGNIFIDCSVLLLADWSIKWRYWTVRFYYAEIFFFSEEIAINLYSHLVSTIANKLKIQHVGKIITFNSLPRGGRFEYRLGNDCSLSSQALNWKSWKPAGTWTNFSYKINRYQATQLDIQLLWMYFSQNVHMYWTERIDTLDFFYTHKYILKISWSFIKLETALLCELTQSCVKW